MDELDVEPLGAEEALGAGNGERGVGKVPPVEHLEG
jgi:hypothetical protein